MRFFSWFPLSVHASGDGHVNVLGETCPDAVGLGQGSSALENGTIILVSGSHKRQRTTDPIVFLDKDTLDAESAVLYRTCSRFYGIGKQLLILV